MGTAEEETKIPPQSIALHKVALPESKSLIDECKRPGAENAGLSWKGREREGSCNMMMSGSHPECGVLPWTRHEHKIPFPRGAPAAPPYQGVGWVGFSPTLSSHQPREPLTCQMASDPGLSRSLLFCSLSKPFRGRRRHQCGSCHQVKGPWPQLCDAASQWPHRAHTPWLLHPPGHWTGAARGWKSGL